MYKKRSQSELALRKRQACQLITLITLAACATIWLLIVFGWKRSGSSSSNSGQLLAALSAAAAISRKPDLHFVNTKSYSIWPAFPTFSTELAYDMKKNRLHFTNACASSLAGSNGQSFNMSIDNFERIYNSWLSSSSSDSTTADATCSRHLRIFNSIYDIKFKKNQLSMDERLREGNARRWLGNNEQLLQQALNQNLLTVYNRYTHEENVFNPLRTKRPVNQPDVRPEDVFKKLMNESSKSCDFCTMNTAYSRVGRLTSQHSYSAANFFPFDEYHELFMSRKHDLSELTFDEFKDLLGLPAQWFAKVHALNATLKYPVVMWDYLDKGGASQMHPHLHGTVNERRYYGQFETIRSGADAYFSDFRRNYFVDLLSLHNILGLVHTHKNAALIVPMTPKKAHDALILSENWNDDVVELLYALLKVYATDLQMFAFSLSIYFPSLDVNDTTGRIPLYVRVVPRASMSATVSDMSSLELLTTFNGNADPFQVAGQFRSLIEKRLPKSVA